MAKNLTTDTQLDTHLKPLKSGEELSSLELSSKGNGARFTGDVEIVGGFVKGDTPTADNHLATKKYVDDNAGGGGGSSTNTIIWSYTARVGSISSSTKFWTAGTYGLNYPFWSSSNALADRDHGAHDTNEYQMASRVIHVPYDGTLKGMTGSFYSTGANTYLFEIWKATPSYNTSTASDLVFSDTALDVTSSGADSYKMVQVSKTDGSVSVSAGDVLAIYVSRASGTSSAYIYLSLNVIMEKS